MRVITLMLTNAEVRALRRELDRFEKDVLLPKLIGETTDPADTATAAYMVVHRLQRQLQPRRAANTET